MFLRGSLLWLRVWWSEFKGQPIKVVFEDPWLVRLGYPKYIALTDWILEQHGWLLPEFGICTPKIWSGHNWKWTKSVSVSKTLSPKIARLRRPSTNSIGAPYRCYFGIHWFIIAFLIRWCPVIGWFRNPINYRCICHVYIHKPLTTSSP